jgi:hypothetical protein
MKVYTSSFHWQPIGFMIDLSRPAVYWLVIMCSILFVVKNFGWTKLEKFTGLLNFVHRPEF